MTLYINIYPPIEEGDFPILRRYWTLKEALQFKEGALRMIVLTF